MQAKLSGPEIARKLNLSRSTIHREINRSKSDPTALARDYQAGAAQLRSQDRQGAGAAARRNLGSDTGSPLCGTQCKKACAATGRQSRSQANCPA
jgi:IS30 family transposase